MLVIGDWLEILYNLVQLLHPSLWYRSFFYTFQFELHVTSVRYNKKCH